MLLFWPLATALAVMAQRAALPDSSDSAPIGLRQVASSEHTLLKHPSFPRYTVRVKRVNGFCEMTAAKTYAGYVDVDARHFFFYFFESRSEPDVDPIVFWMNGGPGCSSTTGLFLENGPCFFPNENATEPQHNPFSWNNKASLLFLEQPVGTGFSYSEHGQHTSTTEEAADDFVAFVSIWFSSFTEFRGRDLHLTGESYAGRMLPVFASKLLDSNARALADGSESAIVLKSMVIVNGFTNYLTMSLTSYDMLCTNASLPPLLPISTCVKMKAALPRCEQLYTSHCIDQFDSISCRAAHQFCAREFAYVVGRTGRNLYDLSEACPTGQCEINKPYVNDYLNRPDVRAKLGIDDWTGPRNITMQGCSPEIRNAFTDADDQLHSSNHFTEALLHRGVRVMHIVGANDWICNWVGNLREASKLSWSRKEEFNSAELREWRFKGTVAGQIKHVEGLSFLTLYGAGHDAPSKKRQASLYVLLRWLAGQEI